MSFRVRVFDRGSHRCPHERIIKTRRATLVQGGPGESGQQQEWLRYSCGVRFFSECVPRTYKKDSPVRLDAICVEKWCTVGYDYMV
jgi:hypothetical protein